MTTATIDQETFTIRFERALRATPDEAFDAWTKPEEIAQWWDPTGAPLRRCEIELRVGGAFVFENEGHSPPFAGVYRVVERPGELVFEALGSVGTVRLDPAAGGTGTRMRVEIRCASAEHFAHFVKLGVHTGTDKTLDNLTAFLQERAARTTPADRAAIAPENTAVRVALWRGLHTLADAPPHVFSDEVGVALVGPEEGWRERADMASFTKPFRASILARARFVEDTIEREAAAGVKQIVLLGAGLDTFAQRRAEFASELALQVFEVDQPGPQEWKRRRLVELGLGVPSYLHFVPVDFERGETWLDGLRNAGFDTTQPAVLASTGVSMYLTREAIIGMLGEVASLATGTTFVMSFMLPIELAPEELRPGFEAAARGAKAAGTPFLSFFRPDEILALAREAGCREVAHVSAESLGDRYFAGRADGLVPPKNAEELLVARV